MEITTKILTVIIKCTQEREQLETLGEIKIYWRLTNLSGMSKGLSFLHGVESNHTNTHTFYNYAQFIYILDLSSDRVRI